MTVQSIIPEGQSGPWRVEKFTVTEDEIKIFNLRCMWSPGGAGRQMKAGDFTRLMRGGTVVMSDTPAEIRDHSYFVRIAKGNVLINGLGLGVCLQMILEKPEVEQVTVIEASEDVMALVAPHFDDPRLTIHHASAFDWQPPKGVRYDAVWHDIWDNICTDNLPEMTKLHRKYGRRTDWQDSWCRDECLDAKRRGY